MAKLQQQQQQQDMPVELNSNEMYQHVQHDWNFGDIKLSSSQSSGTAGADQNHDAINLIDGEHDGVIIEDILDNDGCQDVIEDEVEDDEEEEEEEEEDDDDVVECIAVEHPEQQLIEDDSDAVSQIVEKLQQHQQQQQQHQQQQLHIQDMVHLAQHSFMPQAHNEYGSEVGLRIN